MKYLAQRVLTGEWLHKDLPLSEVERTTELSGPGGITATIKPGLRQMVAPDGLRVIEEWATFIYAVTDADEITHGGIVTSCEYEGDSLRLTAPGFTAYPHGYIFDGLRTWGPVQGDGTVADPETPRPDPLVIFQDLWEWIQAQDDSDLGVKFIGALESGQTVGDYGDPFRLRWYELPDVGSTLDSLAEDTSFDYAEAYRWKGDNVQRLIRLGYPRLGARRTDLTFQQGVNIALPPSAETGAEEFANYVIGLGKGDGPSLRETRGDAFVRDGRLRRMAVVTDKTVSNPDRMSSKANRHLTRVQSTLDVTSIAVTDHPDAPLSSIKVGDDIYVRSEIPAYDADTPLAVWVRVLSITQGDDDSTAVLSTQRSQDFVYPTLTDEVGNPAPPPPEAPDDDPDEADGFPAGMLRVSVANMTAQFGRDRYVLRMMCRQSDVLLLQETRIIDVQALLPDGWRALQSEPHTDRGEETIAVRTSRVTVTDAGGLAFKVNPPGDTDRWLRWARLTDPAGNTGHFMVGHWPRTDSYNDTFTDMVHDYIRGLPDNMPLVLGGDVNRPREYVANLYNMDRWPRAQPKGIMILATKRCRVTKPGQHPDGPGHDHPIPFARVWLGG